MSRHLAQIGTPGQVPDVLDVADVDGSGRLLSVAELQTALRLALQRPRPAAGHGIGGAAAAGHLRGAGDAEEAARPEPAAIDTEVRPDDGHPTAAAPDADPPGPAGAPDPAAAGSGVAGSRDAGDGNADAPAAAEWGANPVPVPAGSDGRPVMVPRPVQRSSGSGSGWSPFPVSELLRLRSRDRDRRAVGVLAGGWPGPRRVVVGSLTGGTGRSTTAALVCAAAADAGVPVLVVDATGGDGGGLASRIGRGAVTRRDWTRLTGREAGVDFAALRRRGGADGPVVAVVAIGGDGGSPPPSAAVAAGAAAGAASWPLVLVDIPHRAAATGAAVRAGGVDLLVMVCRPDPAEIADSGEFLRELTAAGDLDCAQHGVVAVRGDRRGLPGPARRALAAVVDAAAGPLTVPHVPRLTGRRAPARGPDVVAAGRLLTAAAALAPPPSPPRMASPRSTEQ